MVKLAVCDNDPRLLKKVRKEINAYCSAEQLPVKVLPFEHSTELIEYIKEHDNEVELLFINTDMKLEEKSGIDVAAQINELAPYCQVAFISSHLKDAVDTYKTKHFYFILKDEIKQRIPEVIQKAKEIVCNNRKRQLVITSRGVSRVIDKASVLYMERIKRTTFIYTKDEVFRTRQTFKELGLGSNEDKSFIQCHVSYVVSFGAVKIYKRTEFELLSGVVIPISRGYSKVVKDAFDNWCTTQG